jgi:trimeric autotransporter adhesin
MFMSAPIVFACSNRCAITAALASVAFKISKLFPRNSRPNPAQYTSERPEQPRNLPEQRKAKTGKGNYNMNKLNITFTTILLGLACPAFSQIDRVAPTPPPQANVPTNTSLGYHALSNNTTGFSNTALGLYALFNNTTGFHNTATGAAALFSNTTGSLNVATGINALPGNTTGTRNTVTGGQALLFNTTGSRNTATGFDALLTNETGSHNAAYGWVALASSNGNLNIGLGDGAGETLTTGDNNIDIGNIGVAGESNTIRIGTQVFTPEPFPPGGVDHPAHTATYIAGISGTPVAGVGVVVDGNGQLGVLVSSERFKTDIKAMDRTSETLLSLKPVTFHYKHDIDPKGTAQFGLIAEEVEKVNPDLVARDANGKVNTVRYDAVNAMLLNEFLKERRKVDQLEKQVAALTAGLQRVSAQLELSKGSARTVADKE